MQERFSWHTAIVGPIEPVLPLDPVVESLRSSVCNVEWLLSQIESQNGWFRFPRFISETIENLCIQSYPLLYANEKAIVYAWLRGFMSDEELCELSEQLERAPLEERAKCMRELLELAEETIKAIEIPKTHEERNSLREQFLSLSEEEQKEATRYAQHFYLTFLPSFFQSLSVMVHGEKLTSLVAQAMAGCDQAFSKAVQIDRRILFEVPYFKERFARAHLRAETEFSDLISYRLKCPPYRGKIRYKSLWYTFSVLDMTGWLNKLSYKEVRQVCDEIALNGFENRIESDKHLGNRIREYREFQRRGIVTTT